MDTQNNISFVDNLIQIHIEYDTLARLKTPQFNKAIGFILNIGYRSMAPENNRVNTIIIAIIVRFF